MDSEPANRQHAPTRVHMHVYVQGLSLRVVPGLLAHGYGAGDTDGEHSCTCVCSWSVEGSTSQRRAPCYHAPCHHLAIVMAALARRLMNIDVQASDYIG